MNKRYLALFLIAVFIISVGVVAPKALAIGVPANISGDVYFEPTLHATVTFYYGTVSSLHKKIFDIGYSMQGVSIRDVVTGTIMIMSYDQISPAKYIFDQVSILSTSQKTPDDEYADKMKKAEYIDDWSSIDIAVDSEIFIDKNTTRTEIAATPKTIDIPDSDINYNYSIVFEKAYTNNTGSNSIVALVLSNGTLTQEVTVLQGIWRDEINLWGIWDNASQATLQGTVKITGVKITNLNFLHIRVLKMKARVQDHRQVSMKINGVAFSALAHNDNVGIKSVSTLVLDPYSQQIVNYLYDTPSVGATNSEKLKTGAFGWFDLNQLTNDLGATLFGSDYKTYNVDGYELILKAGDTLNERVQDVIKQANDAGASAQEAINNAVNDALKRVTLAIDVNSKALQDNLESASKTVIDATNGALAAITSAAGDAGKVVIDNINGFTKAVNDAAVGAVNQFTSGITGVWTGIAKWWQANWGWIMLFLGMVVVMVVIGVFALIYLKTGGSASPATLFGKM